MGLILEVLMAPSYDLISFSGSTGQTTFRADGSGRPEYRDAVSKRCPYCRLQDPTGAVLLWSPTGARTAAILRKGGRTAAVWKRGPVRR